MDAEPPASQTSSHFPLEPVNGGTLYRLETERRDALKERGNCFTGCKELDDYVLLGGFERGCVVGISAEEDEFGILLGLQTVARLLVTSNRDGPMPTARIITTLATNALLPLLRTAIEAQVEALDKDGAELKPKVRRCLEHLSISRVFEFDGLWEVLSELDHPSSETESEEKDETPPPNNQEQLESPAAPSTASMEIQDSEDEDTLSSPEPPPKPITSPPPSSPPRTSPEIILITHLSPLLTSLFTPRDKTTAHTMLQLLASRLRYLTRAPEHNGPLIILLNTTTSSSSSTSAGPPQNTTRRTAAPKPLDPTLRSIFNPPPLPLPGPGYAPGPDARRNKPSFGLVFTQLLDLHLLCTRVPRARRDAEMVFAPRAGGEAKDGEGVCWVWVVEVLLDEMGVWETGRREGGKARRSREQRWGGVLVDGRGGRVVDGFEGDGGKRKGGEIRVVGGFGGPRV